MDIKFGFYLIVRWSFVITITLVSNSFIATGEEATKGVEEGLVLWLRFEEGEEDIAKDSSGYNNDGKIYGASWVKGKIGGGLQFDGIDDYVDCGSDASLVPTGDFTVEAWIYMNNMPLVKEGKFIQNPILFKDRHHDCIFMVTIIFLPPTSTSMYTRRALMLHFGRLGQFVASPESLSMKKWIHVAATVLDSYTVTVYINGEIGGQNFRELIFSPVKKPLLIGGIKDDSRSSSFNGIIDEVRIYNRALSAEEIKAHYNAVGK